MKEFFHSVKFKILICIAALLLGLMAYVAVAAGTQTLPEQMINTVAYPFVTAANAISNGVNGFIDKLVNADTYKSQNDELRELVTEMYERTADYEELQNENEQLREMLGLSQKHKDFKFSEPCNIIARNANDIYGGFTINNPGKAISHCFFPKNVFTAGYVIPPVRILCFSSCPALTRENPP